MTLNQFIQKLSRTRGWYLSHGGCIRHSLRKNERPTRFLGHRLSHCPLSYIGKSRNLMGIAGGMKLKLKKQTIFRVMDAADNRHTLTQEPQITLRKRLLKATKLTESQ